MTKGLTRYQQTGDFHFVTFSCYQRQPHLSTPEARSLFEHSLETMRLRYTFYIAGYVVMPEHVHLLLSEPRNARLGEWPTQTFWVPHPCAAPWRTGGVPTPLTDHRPNQL